MEDIARAVTALRSPDTRLAYSALKELRAASRQSDAVYPYLDDFLEMLHSPHSYQRTRGFLLAVANARWDVQNKLDAALPALLAGIQDEKPVTARQCVQALPALAAAKPALAPHIRQAMLNANTACYPESMAPLLEKDIAAALKKMAAAEQGGKQSDTVQE